MNVTNCDIPGDEATVTGATFYQYNIESDPLFNNDFTLSYFSPCRGIGVRWWPHAMTNSHDLNGHHFWDTYVDVGAFSTWNGHYRRVPSPARFPADRLPAA